jgi:hypothetical protein
MLLLIKNSDESLTVHIDLPARVLYEVQGSREIMRMEKIEREIRDGVCSVSTLRPEDVPDSDEWLERESALWDTPETSPANKKCLRHIIEKLKSALPVREVAIDERILDGNSVL